MYVRLSLVALLFIVTFGCNRILDVGELTSRVDNISDWFRSRMYSVRPYPNIRLLPGESIDQFRETLSDEGLNRWRARFDTRSIEIANVPLMLSSWHGTRYALAQESKAIVQGAPADMCPVLVMKSGYASPMDAAKAAFSRCEQGVKALSQIDKAFKDCGCRLLALNDLLLVEPEALRYATGVAAHLWYEGESSHKPIILVARSSTKEVFEDIGERGLGVLYLYSVKGLYAVVKVTNDGNVSMVKYNSTANGVHSSNYRAYGQYVPIGFRRGRQAYKADMKDISGRTLHLIIGIEPEEYKDSYVNKKR
jgi:hypothetical protein